MTQTWLLTERTLGHNRGIFYICGLVLAGSLFLGGGTRPGFLSDPLLQLFSIPLFLISLSSLLQVPIDRQARVAIMLAAAILFLPLLQLIPLPPAVWTLLPNRVPISESATLMERGLPWMPISVSPNLTWLSFLSLIPGISVFLATLLLTYRERRLLSLAILAIGIISVFVGLMQLAQGPSSPLRFFEFTNKLDAVGFFANRNNFAALLYSLLPLAAVWAAQSVMALGAGTGRRMHDTKSIIMLVCAFTVLVVLISAQAMARSRAGLGLTIVALFAIIILTMRAKPVGSQFSPAKLLIGATVIAGAFAIQFALYRILERFGADPLEDGRITFARNTVEAAMAYMPFGSGVGTFVQVYGMYEKPQDTMINIYANHAHNDFLQVWLEAGIFGLALIAGFLFWFVLRLRAVWRGSDGAMEIDQSLARASAIIIGLLLVHSFFEYPLRTGAISAVFAFACALTMRPLIAEVVEPDRSSSSVDSDRVKRKRA